METDIKTAFNDQNPRKHHCSGNTMVCKVMLCGSPKLVGEAAQSQHPPAWGPRGMLLVKTLQRGRLAQGVSHCSWVSSRWFKTPRPLGSFRWGSYSAFWILGAGGGAFCLLGSFAYSRTCPSPELRMATSLAPLRPALSDLRSEFTFFNLKTSNLHQNFSGVS